MGIRERIWILDAEYWIPGCDGKGFQGFSCKKTGKTPVLSLKKRRFFTAVFHRILDFKAGLDFYHGPFFIL